jgi:hypothetical protein
MRMNSKRPNMPAKINWLLAKLTGGLSRITCSSLGRLKE